MTKEFLEALGITGENAEKIIIQAGAEIAEENKTVSSKFGDYEDIKTQLKTANEKIEELGKLDYEGVKKSAEDYKAKYEQSVADSAAKLEKMQFEHILDGKIAELKPRNATAVKALLDMDGLKLNGGEIVGLKEQLEKITADNDFLFESSEPMPRIASSSKGGTAVEDNSIRAIMGLAPLK